MAAAAPSAHTAPRTADRFLRLPDVMARTGLGRTSIYQLARHPDPTLRLQPPVRIGSASLWPESAVNEWIERQKARGSGNAAA